MSIKSGVDTGLEDFMIKEENPKDWSWHHAISASCKFPSSQVPKFSWGALRFESPPQNHIREGEAP
jgi:hypothetical protein